MRNIKSYKDFANEEVNWRKGMATAALGASLAMSSPLIANGNEIIDKIENVSSKSKNSNDDMLNNILGEIHSNIKSTDSAKYIELFDKLSSHLSKEYGYEIIARDIPKLDKETMSDMSLAELMGWLGSICLAICGVPQAWMSYKDKHSEGISWAFILLWAFGEAFALAYVYNKLDLPLVMNYLTNILIVAIILYYKINPGKKSDL